MQQLGAELQRQMEGKIPVFVVILKGSFVFSADLVRAYNGPCEIVFTRIKSYNGTASEEIVEFSGFDATVQGREIILVEDIVDTGKTVFHLLKEIEKHHPASVTVVALLQKMILRPNLIKADLTGFEIPDEFVVGYGLDYNEQGRNLDAIWKVKQ